MVTHMRAKHFKCATCKKKLNTANGLKIHLHSVHNQSLQRVPNALPGRDAIDADADAAAANVQFDDANDNNAADDDSDDPTADPNDPKRPRTAATAAAIAQPLPPSMMIGLPGAYGVPHPGMLGMPPMGMMGMAMGMGLPPGFVPPPVAAAAATAAASASAVPLTTTTTVAATDGNVLSAAATMAPTDASSASHLVYDDANDEQMEEKRAQLRKHAVAADSA